MMLAPSVVRWRYRANFRASMAGAPQRFTANRTEGSPRPERWTLWNTSDTTPLTLPHTYGTWTATFADLPKKSSVRA